MFVRMVADSGAATTTYRPEPSMTRDPEIIKQSGRSLVKLQYVVFTATSETPVEPDSSHLTPCPVMRMPSHRIASPDSIRTMSPTTSFYSNSEGSHMGDKNRAYFDLDSFL